MAADGDVIDGKARLAYAEEHSIEMPEPILVGNLSASEKADLRNALNVRCGTRDSPKRIQEGRAMMTTISAGTHASTNASPSDTDGSQPAEGSFAAGRDIFLCKRAGREGLWEEVHWVVFDNHRMAFHEDGSRRYGGDRIARMDGAFMFNGSFSCEELARLMRALNPDWAHDEHLPPGFVQKPEFVWLEIAGERVMHKFNTNITTETA